MDWSPGAVPVQRQGARRVVREGGVQGPGRAAAAGRRRSRPRARGRRDVPAVGRQRRRGRDWSSPVDRTGVGQPCNQRHRGFRGSGDGPRRSDQNGQRRSAVHSPRSRDGALRAPAHQPAVQRRVRRQLAGPNAVFRGHLGCATDRLERVGAPVVGRPDKGVYPVAVLPEVRERGRPRRTGAGRQGVRGRHPGPPVLGRHVQDGQLLDQTILVDVHAPDQQESGQTPAQLDTRGHGNPETGRLLAGLLHTCAHTPLPASPDPPAARPTASLQIYLI